MLSVNCLCLADEPLTFNVNYYFSISCALIEEYN
uniref:Uncharacterized protein n=1 Tax=Arundo donax TaxID=35708 RepID=A0A0A9GVC4_ARUDO